ncbi:MAG: hypothetical protein HC922_01935 [Leptolyngbyaceae cyanobacterium SM2_3_12]|nr:hypothetical protein [Leptolyngbyaceae cyanobacterium SM2_3_12]
MSAEHREDLRIINHSGEHLLTLINDILSMSKIEAGQVTLNPVSFDLPQLLNRLQEMLRFKAESKGLRFTVICQPQVPPCLYGDGHKLRQVLINLLNNAIKFTGLGHVILRVELASAPALAPPGQTAPLMLRFEVEDSGCGIAVEELDLLFDPFVQTSSGRLSQEGTGLGLPISRQFVQLMGGDLEVNSRVGVGSTFSFEIPLEVGDATTAEMTQPQPRALALAPTSPLSPADCRRQLA